MDREEAIEKVRQMSLPKETREIIEALAPELKSEDERIRKFLVDYFTSYKIGDVATKLNGYRIDDILAYLEKQKEQKPAEWGKNDTAFLNEITDFFENKTGRLQHDLDMYAHWLKSLPERFNLQPKQEWLNDELMIKCCQKAIQFFRENAQRKEKGIRLPAQFSVGGYLATPDKVESWLKSLRPQPHKDIYQAAKHDLAIKFMNYLDENRPEGKMCLFNAQCEDIDKAFKENDWAKILRYANIILGKSSEEQPKVDLEKEIKEWVDLMVGASFPEQDGDFISEEDYRSVIRQTAIHFRGLNARKEEE